MSLLPALGAITLLSGAESGALYTIERAKTDAPNRTKFIILTMLLYGVAVPILLYRALQYEGVGLTNLYWNVTSTLSAFFIGWYFFQEDISGLQKIGVAISILGISLILLGKSSSLFPPLSTTQ